MATLPRPRFPKDFTINPHELAAGRYGTLEQVQIWGPAKTFEYSLRAQGQAALTLARLRPDVLSMDVAQEIAKKANLEYVSAARIRQLEEQGGHDVIAINKALEEVVDEFARPHINKFKTSADTTVPARALQLKASLEVVAESVENLRDIMIEKARIWADTPYMDRTHLYDALPTMAGRPFAHYVEMLQSGLKVLKFVYDNSLVGKWADATGNHHSATASDVDGIMLQQAYCADLEIGFMDAPAQVPGLEFEADVVFSMSRFGETLNNIAKFVADGRGDDANVFQYVSPRKQKGSSAMPHKDAKNGNPDAEEQVMSLRGYLAGNLVTAMSNCEMPYARNLSASSNSRINFEDGFKYLDHCIRRLANTIYYLDLKTERSVERVQRSFGVVTSQQVMTYLTDPRRVSEPMARSAAHDLMGQLATRAWSARTPFIDVLLTNDEVTRRLDEPTLRQITDPLTYVGKSKEVIHTVADKYHGLRTLG
jgi:adenylosuccinate lyase